MSIFICVILIVGFAGIIGNQNIISKKISKINEKLDEMTKN
ncbi:hypothetical protein [Paenibacillus apiarius]|nr:hypothetical protein [Paenibacillus apiarius]